MLFILLKKFTEVQDLLNNDLWTMAQGGESLTIIRVAETIQQLNSFKWLMAQIIGIS